MFGTLVQVAQYGEHVGAVAHSCIYRLAGTKSDEEVAIDNALGTN